MKKNKLIKKRNEEVTSLYIHIPFCLDICSYCSFLHCFYMEKLANSYMNKLNEELNSLNIKYLKTIYIGGGTPSCLPIFLIEPLLKKLDDIKKDEHYEFTIECNFDSIDEDKLRLYKRYGVNRLSFGVESFDENILKDMHRHHDEKRVREVINLARTLGFNNINVDLIYGYPKQDMDVLKSDVEKILYLDVEHISTYALSIEERSELYAKKIKECDEDLARMMFDYIFEALSKKAYIRYETSNFSKEHFPSKHNLVYWKNLPYYGIGAGAASYVDGCRFQNTENISKYLKGITSEEKKDKLSNEDQLFYKFMLGLRLKEGLSLNNIFDEVSNSTKKKYEQVIDHYLNTKLLEQKDDVLMTTYEGSLLLDLILKDLL